MRQAARVSLSTEEIDRLRAWVDDPSTSARVRDRARILLWSAAGHSDREISSGLGKDLATVALWRRRFLLHGLTGGLRDAPRPGRKPKHTANLSDRIMHATFNDSPPRAARWSTRALARRFGVSHMLVQRVWRSQGVGPRTSYRIPDRLAGTQLPFVDLLGVILQPPTRVVVIGVELTGEPRVAHVEPLLQSFRTEVSGGHLLHSVRPDPEDLLGLLDGFQELATGPPGRRHQLGNLLILLREIDERTSDSTRIHLLAEGRGAAKDARLLSWLRQHPRFVLHDLPAGAEYEREVGRFLHQWRSVSLRAGSFQGVSTFTRAAARFAGGSPVRADGIAWSIAQVSPPLPPPHTPDYPAPELADAGPLLSPRSGPAPSAPERRIPGDRLSPRGSGP